MPVAPVVFAEGSYDIGEAYERLAMSGEHLSGPLGRRYAPEITPPMSPEVYAQEMAYDAKCRANSGGLADAPDDGGPKAVGSSPVRFGR